MREPRERIRTRRRRTRSAPTSSPTFRQFVLRLSERVGRHQIPANADAHDISELIGPDAIHPVIIPTVLRDVYRANQCGHLDATVHWAPTFKVLGEAWRRLRATSGSDIDQVALIEALGAETRTFFANQGDPSPRRGEHPGTTDHYQNEIVSDTTPGVG